MYEHSRHSQATPGAAQLKPEKNTPCFHSPRTKGAPYPPLSLQEAIYGHLDKANPVPPELAAFDENLTFYTLATAEHLTAAEAIAGVLFRRLEQAKLQKFDFNLMLALCLALSSAIDEFDQLKENMRQKIMKALEDKPNIKRNPVL